MRKCLCIKDYRNCKEGSIYCYIDDEIDDKQSDLPPMLYFIFNINEIDAISIIKAKVFNSVFIDTDDHRKNQIDKII